MKILHSADWHLDSPLRGFTDSQKKNLKEQMFRIPGKIADLCQKENCDLVLLAGDLFDGPYSRETCRILYKALESCGVPVFVSPGNHDYMGPLSPWEQEIWPDNVYVFSRQQVESVPVAELNCRVYGAGFTAMDCPALLENFHAEGQEAYQIGLFHGDPTVATSPYNPISRSQTENCGLDYLALGHIHKAGSFRAGKTLCAWSGCPMGRGFDETGEKGVLIAELAENAAFTRFVPLHCTQFEDLEAEVQGDPRKVLGEMLPSVGNDNFYRITLTGHWENPDLEELYRAFERFPNLQLRDQTAVPGNLWERADQDSFEGVYFRLLRQAMEQASPDQQDTIRLAAKLSQTILEGREVKLP